MKTQSGSIIDLFLGRIEEFCDDYCRFRHAYKDHEDELHRLHCNECPFIRHYKLIKDKGKP